MRTVAALALTLIACGPDGRDDGTGNGNGSGNGSGSGSGNGNTDGCSDAAKLVYVVDSSERLSTFDPATKTFKDLGYLNCPTSSSFATPFSMAIDRESVAWVLYYDGFSDSELMRVDTTNLNCTKSTYAEQHGLITFGMGFSTDTAGGTEDTLYIAGGTTPAGGTSSKLATLNMGTFQATPLGNVTGWPELTGTGSAELWGWFPDTTSPRVEQINKTTGAAVKTFQLPALAGDPTAWAFAFWGGDFWVFLERGNETASKVYQIDGTTGQVESTLDTAQSNILRSIVGAGVSTCAPVIIL